MENQQWKKKKERKMAMKFCVTFLVLLSIGGIHSKTLLEKIRDDSDLSQVSHWNSLVRDVARRDLKRQRVFFKLYNV